MNLNEGMISSLANLMFLLMLPVGLVYYELTGIGLIPNFVGGWTGGIALLSFLILSPIVLMRMVSSRHGMSYFLYYSLIFCGFLIVVTAWSVMDWLVSSDETASDAFAQSLTLLLYAASLFWIGLYADIRARSFSFWIKVFGVLLVAGMIVYVVVTGVYVYNPLLYRGEPLVESGITYQTYSRAAFLVFVLAISLSKPVAQKAMFLAGSLFVLWVLGARSELYAFILISPFLLFCLVKRDVASICGVVVIVAIVVAWASLYLDVYSAGYGRQLSIFDLANDQSWSEREDLYNKNIILLKDHWVLGSHGSHLNQGGAGSYIHNWLSAWQNYGVGGFALYFSLNVIAFFGSAIGFMKGQENSRLEWSVSLALSFSALVLIVFAKPVFWFVPFFAWGYFAARLLPRKD